MSITTAATRLLDLSTPIALAPMDSVAGGTLAAAVSHAGGLGLIGGGYGDPAWLDQQFALAGQTPVGCGFITWSLEKQPDLLGRALRHRPTAIMLAFGDPTPHAPRIAATGTPLLCQIHNRHQAEHALDAGADALVAQGSEAGGHGYGSQTTLTLVPEVADLVRRRGTTTPVLAAGGIADGRGIAAALTLGADGALLGSRFYTTPEALSTPAARERVTTATGAQTCRTTTYDIVRDHPWPPGHTISVLHNDFTARWHGAEHELIDDLDEVRADYRRAAAEHDYDTANVTIGQAAGLIDTVTPAGDLVTALTDETTALLGTINR